MTTIKLSRKNLLAILAGVGVITVITIITNTFSFFITSYLFKTFSLEEISSVFSQQPYVTYKWLIQLISFLSPVFGGLVVGWLVKEKGWLYGGLLGIILRFILLAFALLFFLLPTSFVYGDNFPSDFKQQYLLKRIFNIILFSPLTILQTGIGGYLGEFLHKRKRMKK